jgi:hypothetical protein
MSSEATFSTSVSLPSAELMSPPGAHGPQDIACLAPQFPGRFSSAGAFLGVAAGERAVGPTGGRTSLGAPDPCVPGDE